MVLAAIAEWGRTNQPEGMWKRGLADVMLPVLSALPLIMAVWYVSTSLYKKIPNQDDPHHRPSAPNIFGATMIVAVLGLTVTQFTLHTRLGPTRAAYGFAVPAGLLVTWQMWSIYGFDRVGVAPFAITSTVALSANVLALLAIGVFKYDLRPQNDPTRLLTSMPGRRYEMLDQLLRQTGP